MPDLLGKVVIPSCAVEFPGVLGAVTGEEEDSDSSGVGSFVVFSVLDVGEIPSTATVVFTMSVLKIGGVEVDLFIVMPFETSKPCSAVVVNMVAFIETGEEGDGDFVTST